ncbi:hypothetical protein SpiGrapes_0394 [Sphaerochaeta pleomorpha str. Grapes]|uniref:Sulfatase-modifying factor enzyme-like domain-containing protein n=1 Tax=Sphaerochaeta pleomorpha (strain ATCC BAA-1885 / DSM 22778 / Grapes) TaxID=158190 RepID=G8QVL9_SPHPG|nr:SUMF1/EgtB/PvdO family nonheme iron enzyme [Sphaerochaeta pleomorpha]AEV28252.1 hypothetical protein SpiGrapes_0394 [Sphaerochaeta pleomorpha str. Grapes]
MKKHIELPQVEEVKLPRFLGIRPGIYIFTLLAIGTLLVVFVVCFLPGILKGGRYVSFSSPLAETGLYVDDVYLGGTPYQYFLSSGSHQVVYEKGGVKIATTELQVDHPVFLTYIFHRKMQYEPALKDLSLSELHAINKFNLNEIVSESAITSFDEVTRYSPVFEKWANDAIAMKLDSKMVESSFALASQFISSKPMLQDALKAKEMLSAANSSFSSALSASALLFAAKLFDSDSKEALGLASVQLLPTATPDSLRTGEFVQNGLTYEATTFVMGDTALAIFPDTNEAGIEVQTERFSIATTPVSEYQWALFIEENPQWDVSNKDALQKKGLVDEYYLSGILPSVVFATGKPIHNISFKAAQAFCSWLTEKTGKKVFIPNQEQWTLACKAAVAKPYEKSLTITDADHSSASAMLGGVWEFTDSSYIPLSRLTDYRSVSSLQKTFDLKTDMIVKGGSYLNNPSTITEHTVGAVSTVACGDQIGFRIAWEK